MCAPDDAATPTGVDHAAVEWARALLRRRTGIDLGPERSYVVGVRLGVLASRLGLAAPALPARARLEPAVEDAVVEALLNHESAFFRDWEPFEALRREVLPAVLREARGPARIWSAACATGQEPYSIAMLLHELLGDGAPARAALLASDVSEAALSRARAARYSRFEVNRGLSARHLLQHFEQEGPDAWRLRASVRDLVRFERINLIDPLPPRGQQDVILLRNVMIYLGAAERAALLARIRAALRPGGWLLLGGAESVLDPLIRRDAASGRLAAARPWLVSVRVGKTFWYRRAEDDA